jgi:hypothetical protein
MATVHQATLTPSKLGLVSAWIGSQRWYAGKGKTPALTRLRGYRLDDPAGEVGIETLVVRDDATSPAGVYQIPLTYRGAPLAGSEHALVGTMEHSVLGTRYVYDAPHDPVYAAQLWRFVQGMVDAQSSTTSNTVEWAFGGHGVGRPRAQRHRLAGAHWRAVQHVHHLRPARHVGRSRRAGHRQGLPVAVPRPEPGHRAPVGPRRSRLPAYPWRRRVGRGRVDPGRPGGVIWPSPRSSSRTPATPGGWPWMPCATA